MGREKAGFRDTILLLNERFPDHDLLTIEEVAQWCGMCRNTVKKRIRFNDATKRVSKADLARQVCI